MDTGKKKTKTITLNDIPDTPDKEDFVEDFGNDIDSCSVTKKLRSISNGQNDKKEEEEKDSFTTLNQWSLIGPNTFMATGPTLKTLKPGMYTIKMVNGNPLFVQREIMVDELLQFPETIYSKVISEVEMFWEARETFYKYKFLHRRGYLLYGPQGSGKSCLVQLIIKDIIDRGGIVLNCSTYPENVDIALRILRKVEPNRKLVCLFEDIDAIINNFGEDSILSLLDGENQIDTVLNIATTNYPKKLDKRIIARPRRFDRVIKIDMPSESTRRLYFEKKLSIEPQELDLWTKETKGFSFASLAELVISVKCFNNSFPEAVSNLRKLLKAKYDDEFREGDTGLGFAVKGTNS